MSPASLRLPINGPFVVIAAHVPSAGDEPLPEIESKLRSLDIFSAWRLLPDLQVGIVHVESDRKLDRVVALMSRMTTARVGVSAAFEDLRDTPQALHVARVMLRGPTDPTSSVAVFDGSILATAAVQRAGGDGPNGRRCAGRFWRPSRRGPEDTFRNVSGVAGQRCVGERRGEVLIATRTRSDTGCVGSRNTPADPSRAEEMSPNYVWLSKYIAI